MDREDIYYIKEVGNPINILRGIWVATKNRLISKADWRAIDSPKKRTNEFDLFAVKSKKANKTNSSLPFLGESMARQSAFGFV